MRQIIIATMIVLSTPAHAEFMTGNLLYNRMVSNERADHLLALGYVMGVFDATNNVAHCGGNLENIMSGQARDVAKQFLEANPSTRDLFADVLLRAAFAKAWPCAEKKKGAGV